MDHRSKSLAGASEASPGIGAISLLPCEVFNITHAHAPKIVPAGMCAQDSDLGNLRDVCFTTGRLNKLDIEVIFFAPVSDLPLCRI